MPRKQPAVDSFSDLMFPPSGIDLSTGFDSQTPGTTPLGVNVRLFEAMTERARGGARAGLSKYIAAQLPSGAHLIQHLNVVVDPQNQATLDEDDGSFNDPSSAGAPSSWGVTQNSRNPGRLIRTGGSGRVEYKNKKKKKKIKFVQAAHGSWNGTPSFTISFSNPVTAGNLLVLCGVFSTTSFSDNQGNIYTTSPGGMFRYALALSSGALTMSMTGSSPLDAVSILEYSGVQTVSPQDGSIVGATNTSAPGADDLSTLTGVICPVNGSGELVIAHYFSQHQITDNGATPTFSPGAGFIQRSNSSAFVNTGHDHFVYSWTVDSLDNATDLELLATGIMPDSMSGSVTGWEVFGISFIPQS